MRSLIKFSLMLIFTLNISYVYAAPLKKIEANLSDSMITTKITAKYTKNTLLNPLKISISTDHGRVKLKGNVNNKDAFIQALRLAKSTKGVRSVNADHLEIKPVNTSITDAYITAKVETAILKAKILDDESIPLVGINAKTINGVVTLTGKVNRQSSIKAIIKRVYAVRGVKKINSKLSVK